LLIGQKVVTLDDLETYFREHYMLGYASVGSPNLLSLDIVRLCGVNLVLGQTTDYPLDHIVTFMEKVKSHDPEVHTLLITEPAQYRNLSDRAFLAIDDFLTPPFTPWEFHARMMKIAMQLEKPSEHDSLDLYFSKSSVSQPQKSTWPETSFVSPQAFTAPKAPKNDAADFSQAESSAEDTTHSNLHQDVLPEAIIDPVQTSEVMKAQSLSNESSIAELENESEKSSIGASEGNIEVAPVVPQTLASEESSNLMTSTPLDKSQAASLTQAFTASRLAQILTEKQSAAEKLAQEEAKEVEVEKEVETASTYSPVQPPEDKKSTPLTDSTLNSVMSDEKPQKIDLKGFVVADEYREVVEKSSDKKLLDTLLEVIGKATYLALILFIVSLSAFLIKSEMDGGIAMVGDYILYAEVGDLSTGEAATEGSFVVARDRTPDAPTGETRLFYIPYLGYLVEFARTPLGITTVIIGPSLFVLSYEFYYFMKNRKKAS
jgi:hypothetical protein